MINLSLHGIPVSQARPRSSNRGGFFRTYDPKAKEKDQAKWQIKSQYREQLLTQPLAVYLNFYMPIPKSASKPLTRQMLNGKIFHIKRPDIDNLTKFALDCLNGIVFQDDSQISRLYAKKLYGSEPCTQINIEVLTEQKDDCPG